MRVARAREVALIEPMKRPARIVEALKDVMVDSDGKAATKGRSRLTEDLRADYARAGAAVPEFSPTFVKYINTASRRRTRS